VKYLKSYNESSEKDIIQDCKDILLDLDDIGYKTIVYYLNSHTNLNFFGDDVPDDFYNNFIQDLNKQKDIYVKIEPTLPHLKELNEEDLAKSDEILRLISYLGSCGYEYYRVTFGELSIRLVFHSINENYHVVRKRDEKNFILRNIPKSYADMSLTDRKYLVGQIYDFHSPSIVISDKDWYEENAIKI
jgi:hypothetical protein